MSVHKDGEGPNSNINEEASHSYVTHNFDQMNRAIDTEIQKQELMSVLYRTQRYEDGSRTVLYWVSIICLLALTGATIWWLMLPGHQGYSTQIITTPTISAGKEQALQTLSNNEVIEATEAPFIDTTFTVFHRNLTPSGEHVVTGKTFEPRDLRYPIEQYCYLESKAADGELSGKPLAAYDGKNFDLETQEQFLIDLAELYCRFTKPK
jgi:hypothetical protein